MRRRLTWATVGVVVLALVLSGLFTLVLVRRTAREETRRDLVQQGEDLAAQVDQVERLVTLARIARVLQLEGITRVTFSRAGGMQGELPPGIGAADLDAAALAQGRTVSGARGSIVFAAVPIEPPAAARATRAGAVTPSCSPARSTREAARRGVVRRRRPAEPGRGHRGRRPAGAAHHRAPRGGGGGHPPHRGRRPGGAGRPRGGRRSRGGVAGPVDQRHGRQPEPGQGPGAPVPPRRLPRPAHAAHLDPRLRRGHRRRGGARARAGRRRHRGRGPPAGAAGGRPARAGQARRPAVQPRHAPGRRRRGGGRHRRGVPPGRRRGRRRPGRRRGGGRGGRGRGPGSHRHRHPDRLAQVVANLVENALKFTATTIEVRAVRQGGGGGPVRVVVEDDGPGIPADELPPVFDRLHQSGRTPARGVGSGLGLAIVAELVGAMGGRVRAESPAAGGAGTRMVVELR